MLFFLHLPLHHFFMLALSQVLFCCNPSSDILDYVYARIRDTRGKRKRFSLYLSAHLMYGTVSIWRKQVQFLLSESKWCYVVHCDLVMTTFSCNAKAIALYALLLFICLYLCVRDRKHILELAYSKRSIWKKCSQPNIMMHTLTVIFKNNPALI